MNVFSLNSIRKMALALLIVVSFFTGYRLFIMMIVRQLMSTGNAVVLICCSIDTFPFSLSTNAILDSF